MDPTVLEAVVLTQTVSNTEAGTITATPTMAGTDGYIYTEAGTFTATPALSGVDSFAFAAEAGTITATYTLTGADEYGTTAASTVTFIRDRYHNVVTAG